jgi:hypothetical protein
MSTTGEVRVADAWIGSGFWKFGYVTNDRERAIEHWQEKLGIEEFERFDPTFEIVMADGRSGEVSTRAAFSVGRTLTVELVEPVEGLVDVWADPLRGTSGFTTVFHHTGLLVDDLEALKRAAAAQGVPPVLESWPEEGAPFIYYAPPELGCYVEHMYLPPDAKAMITAVQSRPLPPA